MKIYTLNGFEIAVPDIPEGVTDVSIVYGQSSGTHKGMMLRYRFYHTIRYRSVPPGDWQLLKLSEVPEELAKQIVEGNNGGESDTMFKDYTVGDVFGCFQLTNAHASLTSWVRAQGVDGDAYLLIKKN